MIIEMIHFTDKWLFRHHNLIIESQRHKNIWQNVHVTKYETIRATVISEYFDNVRVELQNVIIVNYVEINLS